MQAGGPLISDPHLLTEIVAALHLLGFAEQDIEWSESCSAPKTPEEFAIETIFVIANSGMQNKVARMIFEKCREALLSGGSAHDVFGHVGKAGAMDRIWAERTFFFDGFQAADDKLAYCRTIPWIGGITSYHLAKNFGADVAKPDTHLQKLADRHGTTAQLLCEELSRSSGFRIATIDLILWRACAERLIDPKTGIWRIEPVEQTNPTAFQQELFQPVQQDLFA